MLRTKGDHFEIDCEAGHTCPLGVDDIHVTVDVSRQEAMVRTWCSRVSRSMEWGIHHRDPGLGFLISRGVEVIRINEDVPLQPVYEREVERITSILDKCDVYVDTILP